MKKLTLILFIASLVASCSYRIVPKSGPYFSHKAKKEADKKMRDTAKNIKVIE